MRSIPLPHVQPRLGSLLDFASPSTEVPRSWLAHFARNIWAPSITSPLMATIRNEPTRVFERRDRPLGHAGIPEFVGMVAGWFKGR